MLGRCTERDGHDRFTLLDSELLDACRVFRAGKSVIVGSLCVAIAEPQCCGLAEAGQKPTFLNTILTAALLQNLCRTGYALNSAIHNLCYVRNVAATNDTGTSMYSNVRFWHFWSSLLRHEPADNSGKFPMNLNPQSSVSKLPVG